MIGSLVGVIVPREIADDVEPVHRNEKQARLTGDPAYETAFVQGRSIYTNK